MPTPPLLLALLLLVGCDGDTGGHPVGESAERSAGEVGGAGTSSPPSSGQQRMLDRLAQIATEVIPDNRFLGDAELHEMRAELAQLEGPLWAARRFDLLMRTAVLELRMGRTAPALDDLESARALLPDLPAADRDRSEVAVLFGLGLARLRQGENDNCVACASPDMCLLPIREGGRHLDQTGSRAAMDALLAVLRHPAAGDMLKLKARWLLNVAAMTVGEWPDGLPAEFAIAPEVFASDEPFPRFVNVAAGVGLDTFSLSGGAVVDDFDGDGRLDVLTSTWEFDGPMHLLRNVGGEGGDGRFAEVGAAAGLTGLVGGLNLVHADYDNDGDVDVFVLRGAWFDVHGRHPNSLLRNDGGRFTDVTVEAGLFEPAYPTQTGAWADYDLDGDLDLYIGNEATTRRRYPGQLFRNEGDGTFTDVAAAAGVENLAYAKGVCWGDYDGDGDPDLFVSNFGDRNRLYRNRGDGSFEDVAQAAGVAGFLHSFPCWFWDFDNDGVLDLYVAAYVEEVADVAAGYLGLPTGFEDGQGPGRLYRGDGMGGFEDVTEAMGLGRLVTTMGANFGDLDNDGWLDFYLGTGYPSYEALVPNVLYRNRAGRGFADVSADAGFGHLQKGHAIAFADLDDDGDQDVFEQMGGAYKGDGFHDALYENPGFGRHWLRLELEGVTSNRSGLGVRVRADFDDPEQAAAQGGDGRRSIFRTLGGGGSFGSNPLHVHLGLGGATEIARLEVTWPASGTTQVFEGVAVDRSVSLREDAESHDSALKTLDRPPIRLSRD